MAVRQEEFVQKIGEEDVTIVMQSIGPFDYLSLQSAHTGQNGLPDAGKFGKALIETICVSPKNLYDKLDEHGDIALTMEVIRKIDTFCKGGKAS